MIAKSVKETQKVAGFLAKEIIRENSRSNSRKFAIVLALKGNLGGGKTTFLQGFANGLGIKEKILSPTFIIMRKIQISKSKFQNFYHIDCYRLRKPKEILDLGFKEIINNPKNIVAIEWADKIKKILPQDAIWLKFKFIDKKIREIQREGR